ncbi:MAG: LLM class flavin-dependent oxidoreductase [Chloroflexota bacterium]|nr:LLM class flavin-dependent oxidoreductase [Chloroflexota bacterium]
METQLPMFDWAGDRRARITFGLQPVPLPGSPEPSRQVIEAGVLADELGFDAFYQPDHPAWAPDCWVHLAAVAVLTRNVRLGTIVSSVPYRSAAHLARLAADVDQLSRGRVVLGLGIGWDVAEFARLEISMATVPDRQAALRRAVDTIRETWAGRPSSPDRPFLPPKQPSGPPIIIAGAGRRTLRLVAEVADGCNFGPSETTGGVTSPDDVRRTIDVIASRCREIGRPVEQVLPTHFTSWAMLGETEVAAQAKVARHYPDGLTESQRKTRLVATPDGAVDYFQSLADAGIRHFVVQCQDATDHETFRLLASDVIPRVRCP